MRWCVLMKWDNSGRWYRAAARFPDKELAEEHARNEYQRHPTMKAWRVEPVPEEGMHPVAHNSGAEPPSVTSDMCTSRDHVGYAGRVEEPTIPTLDAAKIFLQVAMVYMLSIAGVAALLILAMWLCGPPTN